jgi:type IV pilus biogenesis/stability protein PilW
VGEDAFAVARLRPWGPSWVVQRGATLAPPGLVRFARYPRHGVELNLPQAEEAQIPAADGTRFGFRGFVTLRADPAHWRELDHAAASKGIAGALVEAVREAASALRPGSERGSDPQALARELEAGLGRALTARGLELRRLALDSVDFLAADASLPQRDTDVRLLIVGLDGLDWEIADPLLTAGRMPNLARLVEHGVRAKLLSISPLLSPVVWTTIATGVEPSRHGILDFLVDEPTGGSKQPVTSVQRRVPTFWEILSRAGIDVGVVGWWASWPADAVRGYLVSDRVAYQLFGYHADPRDASGKTWPPALYPSIRPELVQPTSVPWSDLQAYLDGSRRDERDFDADERERLDGLRTLLASTRTYAALAHKLSAEFKPRLEVVYFEGTDTVGHLFMPFRPPPLPGIDPRDIESFGAIVDRYYEEADRRLGALLEGRGPDWTVLVVSDHGFASDQTRPQTTDSRIGHGAAADWHRRFGVLVLSGAHVRAPGRLDEASVYDIAPTVLALFGQPVPQSWPGRVLADALDPTFLTANPVRFRLDDPKREDLRAEALDDPAAADLLEKLESLGYVGPGAAEAGSATARNNTGVAFLAEGRFADAERELRDGIRENPDVPMLRVNLALALRAQGRLDEAAREVTPAVENPATFRAAGHLLAEIRMEQDDLPGAEELLRRVLAHESDAADLRTSLGKVLDRKGDLEAAEREYRRAAEIDPDAALPRNHLGTLYRRRGDLAQAAEWYRQAIEADPYFMGAYNNLALVYQDQGRMDEARELYARALTKAPNNAEVLNNLGSWHYSRGELDAARDYWNRAAAAKPNYPSPLNNLAGLDITADHLDSAEKLLGRALALDPGYGDARMNLALVYRLRGRLDDARAELERAAQDARTGAAPWIKLGAIDLEAGRVDAALRSLERARTLAPRSVEALNYLGEAYRRAGRRAEARAVFERSLTLDPRQEQLRQYVERELSAAP